MIWQKEFDNLQKEKHSLCELLIIRSLVDLTEYDSENEKWNGFVTKKLDQFEVGLDFIAAKVGYYAWKQVVYSEEFESDFEEDKELSEILYDFRGKRKNEKIPKSTSFFSKNNFQLRQEIINKCITRDALEKVKMKCNIFNISEDVKYVKIEKNIIDSFDPKYQINSMIKKLFPYTFQALGPIQEKTGKKISEIDWNKIKKIQDNKCFFCNKEKPLTQDHFIPYHRFPVTKPFNIVGACRKCNRGKWYNLPSIDEFKTILKRNDEYSELFKKDYDKEKYVKEFKKCEKTTKAK